MAGAPDLGKSACLLEDRTTQAEVPVTLSEGIARPPGITEWGLDSHTAMPIPSRGPSGSQRPPCGRRKEQRAKERRATGDPGGLELPGPQVLPDLLGGGCRNDSH